MQSPRSQAWERRRIVGLYGRIGVQRAKAAHGHKQMYLPCAETIILPKPTVFRNNAGLICTAYSLEIKQAVVHGRD